jgi:predicted homoserine dehydrogenase-like protein
LIRAASGFSGSASGRYSVVEEPFILCKSHNVDVILEVTGAVEFGVQVVCCAIENNKHVVMMNAELDGTIGPILKTKADAHSLVITNVDGD